MKPFPRRKYDRISELWQDLHFLVNNRPILKKARSDNLISPAFRERLMLVVTQVNGCRYCSYYHAKEALKAGISNQELKALLDGIIPLNSPEDECAALTYAQHWAEQDAQPDPEATGRLVEVYGQEVAQAIQVILRVIRVGNLLGNTGDYWLYRLSFGRFGLRHREKPSQGIAL